MAETLLTPSSIKLFGRVLRSLSYTNDTKEFGGNNFLQNQLAVREIVQTTGDTVQYAAVPNPPIPVYPPLPGVDPAIIIQNIPKGDIPLLTVGMLLTDPTNPSKVTSIVLLPNTVISRINGPDDPFLPNSIFISRPAQLTKAAYKLTATLVPVFARIYSFSVEGAYYQLPRPAVFLVHGPGQPVGNWANPSAVDQSGVLAREWDFSGNGINNGDVYSGFATDVSYWEYEKGDFSIRVDLDAGPFEQILLQMALRGGADMADRSGQGLGIRSGQGLDARSGQGLDIRSGQGLRR
jgi:hypothetical protein